MSNLVTTPQNSTAELEVKLSQTSLDPPSLLVTLRNNHPSITFTLLRWGTPLDPQAVNLGVFGLIDAETGERINVDIIKIARKTPPAREDLVEIEPGSEHAVEVVFDKPWMPDKKPAKYNIKAKGTFYGGWDKGVDDITADELEAYSDSLLGRKRFESEQVLMVV